MIFRISTKLGKKIHVTPDQILPVDLNPFADWSVHLFTADRTQYVPITNTISLYSMVMFGRGLRDDRMFLEGVTDYMSDVIRSAGNESIFEKFIVPSVDIVRFSKALNRSVTGSINDFILQAKFYLTEGGLSPFEVSFRLNETPMSYLDYGTPIEKIATTAVYVTDQEAAIQFWENRWELKSEEICLWVLKPDGLKWLRRAPIPASSSTRKA